MLHLTLPAVTVTKGNVSEKDVNPRASARSQRWAKHREQRREELIEAAIDAIRQHGTGVSVAAMAAQAGVTKPVVYRHFADRADLQRAISDRAASMLLARLMPELETERELSEHVRGIVDAFLAGAEEEPELWRFVVHGESEAGPDVVAHNIALVAGLLTAALGDRLRERGLDSGGAEAWAYGLAGMVYTAGDWWLQRRTMTRAALTDYLVTLIKGGLTGVFDAAGSETPDTGRPLRLVAGDEEGQRGG